MSTSDTANIEIPQKTQRKFKQYLIASLVLHMVGIFMLQHAKDFRWSSTETANEKETMWIELDPARESKVRHQIVESDLTKKADKAAENAFLSAQTQVVKTQTKATTNGAFRTGRVGGGKIAAEKPQEQHKDVSLSKLGVAVNMKPLGNIAPGERAQTSDYIKDIKDGAETLLNTKEFVFFSFYQRVRRQLEQYWEPSLRAKLKNMLDRGRMIASEREHNTKILVVMNRTGVITAIKVSNTSGLLDLDQAAVEAFNKAGPFPNPPQGMVDVDGTVKVEWEFILRT